MVVAALDAVAAERLAAGEAVRRRGSSSHKWSSRHTSLSHRHTSEASRLLPSRHWLGQKIRSIVPCRLQNPVIVPFSVEVVCGRKERLCGAYNAALAIAVVADAVQ